MDQDRKKLIALGIAAALAMIAVLVILVARGGDGDGGNTAGGDPKDLSEKPAVEVPEGPVEELETEDIVRGKGRAAKRGDTVEVQYVGVAQSTGEEFDSSWERDEPFSFELGAGNVIRGWDQGVAGMRVGGRRQLVIPSELAYGEEGQPPSIGPDETLIFVIDMKKIS